MGTVHKTEIHSSVNVHILKAAVGTPDVTVGHSQPWGDV